MPYFGNRFDYEIRVDLQGSGSVFYDYGLAWWTTVPEPPMLVLMGSGVMMLVISARRKRKFPAVKG